MEQKVTQEHVANYKYQHAKVYMADAIPLDTPFTVVIEPTNVCNFRCSFCFHGLSSDSLHAKGYKSNHLDLDNYKRIIDDLAAFPSTLKVLRFSGFGEPLLHPQLPVMVEYAKRSNVAERVMVISNGSRLSPKLSDELIAAGLDELFISVEGTSTEKYRELCSASVEFDDIVKGLRYFYEKRNDCKVFARILNHDLCDEELSIFRTTFEPITSNIFVDNIIPLFNGVDYSETVKDFTRDIEGNSRKSIDVCVQPFNSLFIHASCNVSACCVDYLENLCFGNALETSLPDIWNGEKLKRFRIMQLKKARREYNLCANCDYIDYVNQDENNLDDRAKEILKRIR